jgi:diketogulonate reductase-like aldo/keto reductase
VTQISLKLTNGIAPPQFGLGVYLVKLGGKTENAVKTALKLGYRHIDTAHTYQSERLMESL